MPETTGLRPLYAGAHAVIDRGRRPAGGHAGLWYDKFYSGVARDPRQRDKNAHRDWIATVTRGAIGDGAQMDEAAGRRRLMVESLGGALGYFEATSRFVTGLGRAHPVENGFAWHATLGTPYLPGSSIKGLVRAWAREQVADAGLVDELLGAPGHAGQAGFLDGLPVAPVQLEADVMTPHYGPYYQRGEAPGDWHGPVPIPFLVAAAGMKLQVAVLADERVPADRRAAVVDTAMGWLEGALAGMGAGAKTAVGYGRFRCVDGARIGEQWVAELHARRRAAMTPVDRARAQVSAMSEQEAMACVRRASEGRDDQNPEEREALRQALSDIYLARWEEEGMGQVGKKKRRAYLAWLRGVQTT